MATCTSVSPTSPRLSPSPSAAAASSASLRFPRLLASNSAAERNGALKHLRRFLVVKSQQKGDGVLNFVDLLKLWKGLFYCLWSQDKPLIQEELCDNLSSLLHCLHSEDLKILFATAFWVTLSREWNGIDRLRLDKFYMLVRRFLRQLLFMLKKRNWEERLLERVCVSLESVLLCPSAPPLSTPLSPTLSPTLSPRAPAGLRFHVSEVFLEELARVGADELTPEQCQALLRPFILTAASTTEVTLLKVIVRSVFQEIIDQSPFAVSEILKETRDGADDDDDHDDDDDDDIKGPFLQFDYTAVATALFQAARQPKVRALNRKQLYRLTRKFHDLADGVFPREGLLPEVSDDEDEDEDGRRGRRKKSRAEKVSTDKKTTTTATTTTTEAAATTTTTATKKKKKRNWKKGKKIAVKKLDNEMVEKEVDDEDDDDCDDEEVVGKLQFEVVTPVSAKKVRFGRNNTTEFRASELISTPVAFDPSQRPRQGVLKTTTTTTTTPPPTTTTTRTTTAATAKQQQQQADTPRRNKRRASMQNVVTNITTTATTSTTRRQQPKQQPKKQTKQQQKRLRMSF